jgi:hypothetical protein
MDQGPADALEEEALEEEAVAGEESGYDTD